MTRIGYVLKVYPRFSETFVVTEILAREDLGQDLSIGYLSHDAESIELYLQETLTFLPYTSEASVVMTH